VASVHDPALIFISPKGPQANQNDQLDTVHSVETLPDLSRKALKWN
jgi:hypothetical protein